MTLIEIIDKLQPNANRLFNKAFKLWCNIVYEKDEVYTEELVSLFMKEIFGEIIIEDIHNMPIIYQDNRNFILFKFQIKNYTYMYIHAENILERFITKYEINRIS